RTCCGGVAELLDPQRGMRSLRRGGGGQYRRDAVLRRVRVAGELELDERRAPVTGGRTAVRPAVRRAHALDARRRGDAPRGGPDRGAEGGCLCRAGAGSLDQHLLGRALREIVGQDAGGAARLARAGLRLLQVTGADRTAEDHGYGDEGDPAEDRGPAVRGAP